MSALTDETAEAFRLRAAQTAEYGRRWWRHDPTVQDLCRRLPRLRLQLQNLEMTMGEVTTSDVYALVDNPRWPEDWRTQRHAVQRAALAELPRKLELLDAPPATPSAYVMLGLPGSGKTSVLRPVAWGHYRSTLRARDRDRERDGIPAGAAVLDADELRVLIPEYQGGLGGGVVQPETAALTYGPRWSELLKGGYSGLLVDTVGHPDTTTRTVVQLSSHGYSVCLLLAVVEEAVARERVMQRCLSTGRLVSLAYLRDKVGVPEAALEAVLASGTRLAGWGVWDTTDQPRQIRGDGAFAPDPSA